MKRSYKLQSLDCANCASKMETAIGALPSVSNASINFMTQKLVLDADVPDADALDALLAEAQSVISRIEPDCVILR